MKSVLGAALLLLCFHSNAQKIQNFGKVSVEDLSKKVYEIDSAAGAVVLFDRGSAEIEGNSKGWFSIIYKRHCRIHILNKSEYDKATVIVQVYEDKDHEVNLTSFKAATYNLENGKVSQTKIDKRDVLKEKLDKEYSLRKFTLPQVKEGSIIEYEYTIKSDFITAINPWYYQRDIPSLLSEFQFAVPDFLNYVVVFTGHHPFIIKDRQRKTGYFMSTRMKKASMLSSEGAERAQITTEVSWYRWMMKDIPGLKLEPYTASLRNHQSRMEFQLSGIQEPFLKQDILRSWLDVCKDLRESENFGKLVFSNTSWLNEVVQGLVRNAGSKEEKARNIYYYVRDNFTTVGESSVYTSKSLKEVMQAKSGAANEINLLLMAMLKQAGLEIMPVILSTRDNGRVYENYPMLSRYNYVIAMVYVDGNSVMLDASHPRLGFGKLLPNNYNGTARVIDAWGSGYDLHADSLIEKKSINVRVLADSTGRWHASKDYRPGYYESLMLRDKIFTKGESELKRDIQKELGGSYKLDKVTINNLKAFEEPLALDYTFEINSDDADVLYINPMMGEGMKQNPFTSVNRHYPVELPFAMEVTYNLTFQIPEGYELDEMPKQISVKLNSEGDVEFQYLIEHSLNTISMRSHLQFKRAEFKQGEYTGLRDFYKLVVDKHSEPIVLKRKKL